MPYLTSVSMTSIPALSSRLKKRKYIFQKYLEAAINKMVI